MVMATVDEVDLERKFETIVTVRNPRTCCGRDVSPFTTYAIHLESNHPCFSKSVSIKRRRYSEFVCLRKLLGMQHLAVIPPTLPPKHFFYRFDPDFIEQRRAGLQSFLQKVLDIPLYLSNTSVHKFLQSNSSIDEIARSLYYKMPLPKLDAEKTVQMAQLTSWSSQESLSDSNWESTTNLDPTGLATLSQEIATEVLVDSGVYMDSAENATVSSKLDFPLHVFPEVNDSSQKSTLNLPNCDEIDSKTNTTSAAECPLVHPDLLKIKNSSPIPCKNILRKSYFSDVNNSLPESEQFLSSSGSPPDAANVVKKVSFCKKITVAQVHEAHWQIAIRPIKDVK